MDDFIGNYQQTFDQLEQEIKDKDEEILRLNHQIQQLNNSDSALVVNKQLENELEEILKENNDLHQDIVQQKNVIADLEVEANQSRDLSMQLQQSLKDNDLLVDQIKSFEQEL